MATYATVDLKNLMTGSSPSGLTVGWIDGVTLTTPDFPYTLALAIGSAVIQENGVTAFSDGGSTIEHPASGGFVLLGFDFRLKNSSGVLSATQAAVVKLSGATAVSSITWDSTATKFDSTTVTWDRT